MINDMKLVDKRANPIKEIIEQGQHYNVYQDGGRVKLYPFSVQKNRNAIEYALRYFEDGYCEMLEMVKSFGVMPNGFMILKSEVAFLRNMLSRGNVVWCEWRDYEPLKVLVLEAVEEMQND